MLEEIIKRSKILKDRRKPIVSQVDSIVPLVTGY